MLGGGHNHSPDPPQGLWQLPSPGGAGKVERQWRKSFLGVQKSPVRVPTLALLRSQVRKVSRRDTESRLVLQLLAHFSRIPWFSETQTLVTDPYRLLRRRGQQFKGP